MPAFRYDAYSFDGMSTRGTVEAENENAARERLQKDGLRIQSIRALTAGKSKHTKKFIKRRLDPEMLFSDLAVLLDAGLAFERSLSAIAETEGASQSAAKRLLESLSEGSSPSDAFRTLSEIPEETCVLIQGGEQTGQLATVFNMVAAEFKRQRERRNQLFEAISYPIFLVVMMMLAILMITFYLVPAVEPIFESAGKPPPLIISLLGSFGRTLNGYAGTLSLIIMLAGLFLISQKSRRKIRVSMIAVVFRTPVIGSLAKQYIMVRYLRGLSLSLANGVDMQHALKLSAEMCAYPRYRDVLLSLRDRVVSGATLPESMKFSGIFPIAVVSLASVGDAVNSLPLVLSRSADVLDADASRLQAKLLAALSPAITILMGLLIGSLVVSVMSALLSINELSLQ